MDTEQKRYNVNDLDMYTEVLADWKARWARKPVSLKKPYVLWGRLIYDIGSDKQPKVVPTVSEMPVTLMSAGESKIDARFKRGWRILDYWVPKKSELKELSPDDVQHGWRFQYATDPKAFEDIASRLEYYKALGEGRKSSDEAVKENINLKAKLKELQAKVNDPGNNKGR